MEMHRRSLTASFDPEKWMVGRQAFPFGKGHFQGRTGKLPGSIWSIFLKKDNMKIATLIILGSIGVMGL